MKYVRLSFVFGLLWAANAFAYVTGPDPAMNGIFGQTCNQAGCHNSFTLNSGGGSVTLAGLPDAGWIPGQTYALTVTIKGPASQRLFGFQLSAVFDATSQQAGTLTGGAGVQIICGRGTAGTSSQQVLCSTAGSIQYAEHSNAQVVRSTYSVNWTAPASASGGTVRFNVAGNAADGNLQPTGDYIYTQVYKVTPLDLSSHPFTLVDRGGVSVITDGAGDLNVGYARILATSGTTPSGVAIFGERIGGVLVTEAGVPASPLLSNGRIYAEVGPGGFNAPGTDIGLAVANPNVQAAIISFFFTSKDGTDVAAGTFTLNGGTQFPAFLDQQPWNCPLGFQGTFSFSSNVPISVIALQGYRNERNDFLITTLPVIDTTSPPSIAPAVLSQFTDGDGWSTSVLLVNPSDTPMSGTIQFRVGDGTMASLTANGQTAKSFNYTVGRRSSFKLQTAGAGSLQVGSVTVTPATGNNTPVSLAVFSYATSGITITQAGVPSNTGTKFRAYVEATAGLGLIGTYSTGVAIADTSGAGGTVTFDLYTTAGTPTGLSQTFQVPAFGQISKFIGDIFQGLPLPFQGILRVTTSSSSISAVALRIRYNERNEFLMTTTPPANEDTTTTIAEFDFPHILNGGGFTTQFILFSGAAGQTSSGNLKFLRSDSSNLSLNVQ
jgi:hypothetical protein